MRLRATRLSATGGHTRKRGIDIAALFAGYPGRVGCYYGTKSGPSYSDILARNREALGPELVTIPTPRVLNLVAYTADQMSAGALTPGAVYLTVFRISSFTSGSIRSLFFGGTSATGSFGASTGFVFSLVTANAGNNSTWLQAGPSGFVGTVEAVSVRQITDWSKLVLFDDANGTVPVFSVFQSSRGRGLLLDASQGLVRGPEQLTNGDFSGGASGWAVTGNDATHIATFAGGALRYQSDTTSPALLITQTGALVSGKVYEIVTNVSSYTSGSMKSDSFGGVILASRAGENRVIATATTTVFGITRSTTNVDMTIDGISVRELPGNHMQQPTAAARGELSARYNLLTATDGSDASWAKTGVSANLTETATTGIHELRTNSVALTAGLSYTQMARVYRIGARRYFRLGASGAFGAGGYCVFDLVTGTVTYTSAAVVVGSIMEVSPGVFDCFIRFTPTVSTSATNYLGVNEDATTGTSFAGVAGDGIGFLGADLRLTADAIPSIPAYQRVTSATDYDDVGFPVYHLEQTDDWAYADINPSGATKVLVMWGGQKLSDSSESMLLESSVSSSNNPGTFALWQTPPSGMGNQMRWRSRGSGNADVLGGTAAPSRTVARGVGSITDDLCVMAVNGVVTSSSADQGTGTYINQRHYSGARAGASLFARRRTFAPELVMYSQTGDPGPSASQIAALDKAFAKAAGVPL